MTELISLVLSWRSLLMALIVFGIAPGLTLRLLVKIYPRDDPRRRELIAQLYVLGRVERLLFVAEQLETVLFEGLPHRLKAVRRRLKRQDASLDKQDPTGLDPTRMHELAAAAVSLISAVEHQKEAVLQSGPLLLIKSNGVVCTRVLSPDESLMLRRQPELLRSPEQMLALMADNTVWQQRTDGG